MAKQKNKEGRDDRIKILEATVDEIRGRFGDGAIMKLGEAKHVNVDAIPTGSISLDLALGVGGLPKGRIIEIFGLESSGKSTLALHAIAEVQRRGGLAAFIDAEHALDPEYAKKIGVKVNDLFISQPDTGEQALEILESLVKSGAVDLVVVDSVAALTPRVEIEGEMGQQHIGLQARLMSQALRKLTAITAKSETTIVFINQIRMKIGVMFGCFSYDSLVTLADGSKKKIGTIVNQRLPLNVLSYNFKKKCIEPQRIVNWHINGETDTFLQFFIQNHTGNGRRGFSCTPEHKIYTAQGWKKAGDLQVGDEISILIKNEKLTSEQEQLLLGSILGDGNLKKNNEQTAYFREEHGAKQALYVRWLGEKLGNLSSNICLKTKRNNAIIESRHLLRFGDLYNIFYPKGKKIVPEEIVEYIDPQAIAAWYCGDGTLQIGTSRWKGKEYIRRPRATIYTNGFQDKVSQQRILRIFHRFDIKTTLRKINKYRALLFSVSQSKKLFELIAPYVSPAMWHKLPISYHKHYKKSSSQETQIYSTLRPMKIKKIKKRVPGQDGTYISKRRFDISVSENHNYFVDGCLVSNSPEDTPGGKALKFYSSVRLELRRAAKIQQGDQIIGNRIKAKVVKNKVAPPFQQAEFDIFWNEGISRLADIINTGLKFGVVSRRGAWFNYGEEKLGQGLEGAKAHLKENPRLVTEIVKGIKKAVQEQI